MSRYQSILKCLWTHRRRITFQPKGGSNTYVAIERKRKRSKETSFFSLVSWHGFGTWISVLMYHVIFSHLRSWIYVLLIHFVFVSLNAAAKKSERKKQQAERRNKFYRGEAMQVINSPEIFWFSIWKTHWSYLIIRKVFSDIFLSLTLTSSRNQPVMLMKLFVSINQQQKSLDRWQMELSSCVNCLVRGSKSYGRQEKHFGQ